MSKPIHTFHIKISAVDADGLPAEYKPQDVVASLADAWAEKAADDFFDKIESTQCGPLVARAIFDEATQQIYSKFLHHVVTDHWRDSPTVRAMFPKAEKTQIVVNNVLPDLEVVQDIVRDSQGRAAQIRTQKRAAR